MFGTKWNYETTKMSPLGDAIEPIRHEGMDKARYMARSCTNVNSISFFYTKLARYVKQRSRFAFRESGLRRGLLGENLNLSCDPELLLRRPLFGPVDRDALLIA